MHLKSIEIRGFKSFADKVELDFKNGITAVVGPNGSGKSNISDAVRWVLGEQSVKSLRGGKMEDVIFAGTVYRKPLGLAQVSLILDNSDQKLNIDYSEVIISRRLYRSGESEYYINNTLCRLKDVHELFMDTGIGKEGYSIIGQGKIDAILSGKPDERRNLLEEAAGIVKFRTRKDEAEKKLYNTDQNLTRLGDIISTYEDRLEPLRLESEKAKIFLTLSDELKEKELNVILDSIEKFEEKMSTNLALTKDNNESLNILITEKEKIKAQNDEYNIKVEEFDTAHELNKNKYFDYKSRQQDLENDNNITNEKIENLKNTINKNNDDINVLTQKKIATEENYNTIKSELDIFKADQISIDKVIEKNEFDIANKFHLISADKENLSSYKAEQLDILTSISNTRNSKNLLFNNLASCQDKIKNNAYNISAFENSIVINSATISSITIEMNNLNKNILEITNNIKVQNGELNIKNNDQSRFENILRTKTSEFHKLEAHKNMLINLEKNFEGYNRAVKAIMNDIRENKINVPIAACNVLGEVIDVPKQFETAIEVALGGAISDIITKNEEVAKTLIEYLKSNNLGRATFLPLNIIKGNKLNIADEVKKINGYIGVCSELLSFDKVYENVINSILGRIIVARDMDSALFIAKKLNYGNRIVTLSGEIINAGGALTGGSLNKKSVNLISRKREIDECNEQLTVCNKEIFSINASINLTKENIKKINDDILNFKDEIHYITIDITKYEEKIRNLEVENQGILRNINILKVESKSLESERETLTQDISKAESKLLSLSDKDDENKQKIIRLEEVLLTSDQEYEISKSKLMNLKINKAQIDEKVLSNSKEVNRLHDDIKVLDFSIIKLSTENSELKIESDMYLESIAEREIAISSTLERILETDEIVKSIEVEKLKIKELLNSIISKLEDVNSQINKREDERHKLDLINIKLETEKASVYEKLNDSYNLTLAEAYSFKKVEFNASEYKKRIDELKKEVTKLGLVNVAAIEEYSTTKEKYTFLTEQRDDLLNAKEELLKVINEITVKMKHVFSENFKRLRVNFDETFKELFNGGSADLILADGDELTSNIEINVQPPGKKLQNINLMSGGEKGLSAIALLFAILKMKPTPFCILDEIEAALDDANVYRYAEFLKKFSSDIQFVIITHRKGTMEASDVLYGVTMEEKGVSKVVSVDFKS